MKRIVPGDAAGIVPSGVTSDSGAVSDSLEEFAAFIKAEQVKWAKVITETGITSE